MKKKTILRTMAALLCALFVAEGIGLALPAHAASVYETKYSEKSNWEELILPALQKTKDENAIYRQLKLSMQYQTLSEGNLYNLYMRDDVFIPVSVLKKLYDEELISGYLYKTIAGGTFSAEDFKPVFDADTYYADNPDLQSVIGADPASLFAHFLNNGMAEGRSASKEFNLSYYKENYPDLVKIYGSDNASYYAHYILYGKAEGRIADKLK